MSLRHMGNLPAQLTSFVGREEEIARAKQPLLDNSSRLVTLTGPGGCGKTRLAIEVAAQVALECPIVARFVDLADLPRGAGEDQLLKKIAAALDIGAQEPGTEAANLIDYLRSGELLLLLDNCEHVAEACARAAHTLLVNCPGLRILATSRHALNAEGEVIRQVPPLSMPDPGEMPDFEELVRYEAIGLFVERARAKRPEFVLNRENARAVVGLCARLDGLPLAIELAAARVRILTVEQIEERLDDRFHLLTGSSVADPRQQSLQTLVDWSYGLLSEEEQALFRELSVFAGGFSLEAAEAVTLRERAAGDTVELLGQLVDKSMMMMEVQDGEARYSLLETLRQYAAEKLRETGQEAQLRGRHLQWYLNLAERAGPHMRGVEQTRWLNTLQKEEKNLRAALLWSRSGGQVPEAGVRIAGALEWFWIMHGRIAEGREQLSEALKGLDGSEPREIRAQALNAAGRLAWFAGDSAAAERFLSEARLIWDRVGDKKGSSFAHLGLGYAARDRGDYEEANAQFEEALRLAREGEDSTLVGQALMGLGFVALRQGQEDRAEEMFVESISEFEKTADRYGVATSTLGRGYVAQRRNGPAEAMALFKETLRLLRPIKAIPVLTECLEAVAVMAHGQGRAEEAARLYGAAEALLEAHGFSMDYMKRVEHRRILAEAKRLFSGQQLEAWNEGRRLGISGAIELALNGESRGAGEEEEASGQGNAAGILSRPLPPPPYPEGLTPRHMQVLRLVVAGLTDPQVGARLGISKRTVEAHLRGIYRKLGVSSRAAAIQWAVERGLFGEA